MPSDSNEAGPSTDVTYPVQMVGLASVGSDHGAPRHCLGGNQQTEGWCPGSATIQLVSQQSRERRVVRRINTAIWLLAAASFVWAAVVWWWLLRAYS